MILELDNHPKIPVDAETNLISKLNDFLDNESLRGNTINCLVNLAATSGNACKVIIELKIHKKVIGYIDNMMLCSDVNLCDVVVYLVVWKFV